MNQTFSFRCVRVRMVLLSIGGTVLAGVATAQSGDLTQAERDALRQKLQEMDISPERASEAASRRLSLLRDADADGDGLLTEAELMLSLEEGFSRMDRNSDGVVRADDAPRFAGRDRFLSRVSPIIAERDADGDGGMSFAEFSNQPLGGFDLLDEDDDGQVSLDTVSGLIESQATTADT